MKPIIIHHRSVHHASNSGYSRLIDYLSEVNLISGNVKFPHKLAKFISKNTNQNASDYDSLSVLKEIELFKHLLKSEQQLVHYLNAERDIRHIVNYKNRFKNVSFCGTFHKPPLILQNQIKDNSYLKKLDGAIAVGENQVEFLKNWLKNENVTYIPHGVDTNFFVPNKSKKKNNTIMFVGQHLRDFKLFNTCIPIIAEKISDLKINVVIRKEYVKQIESHSAINIFSGINDFELRSLYQESSLLFLPLKDVTACNSILEALACGLPIVTTDVGGNSSYLNGTKNILAPPDKDFTISAIINLLNNENKLIQIGESSREHSLNFDWSLIVKQIELFYKSLVV